MKLRFVWIWNPEDQKLVSKGKIVLTLKQEYLKEAQQEFKKLKRFQEENNVFREIDGRFDIHYKDRSLDQNRLLFALCNIIANEINHKKVTDNQTFYKSHMIYKEIEEFTAPVYQGALTGEKIKKPLKECNTVEFSNAIEYAFEWLGENGIEVTAPGQIKNYWMRWQEHLSKKKIISKESLNIKEYRQSTNICEACLKYDPSGQVAHIRSRGAGGEDVGSNLLYLCHLCHIIIQHQKGWEKFKSLFPHLKFKIDSALEITRDLFPEKKESENKTKEDILAIFEGEEIEINK